MLTGEGREHHGAILREAAKLADRYRMLIHPEAVDGDLVYGPFLGIKVGRAHQEYATRHPDHARVRRRFARDRSARLGRGR